SVDNTTVTLSGLSRNFDPALGLLGEMLISPRFDPKDFDRERDLQLTDLRQGPDNPGWIAQRAFRALLYGPKHPYGNPREGYTDTVKALTGDGVRAFHKAHFAPGGATLVVVGDVSPEALVASVERSLGQWDAKVSAPKPRPATEVKADPKVAYLVDKPG